MINFIHRFKVLSRWTRERNFNKDALLRLLGFVDKILEVHYVGCTELTLCVVSLEHKSYIKKQTCKLFLEALKLMTSTLVRFS